MITYHVGDMLESDATILVNPVNCVGVMGKGLALQFKKKFPQNFADYKYHCDASKIAPGDRLLRPGFTQMCVTDNKIIINAATKDHWRDPSQIEWIKEIVYNLCTMTIIISKNGYHPSPLQIAIPPLDCGLGGLNKQDVLAIILKGFDSLKNDKTIDIQLWNFKEKE